MNCYGGKGCIKFNTGQKYQRYFYHSDHLGSSAWITDVDGEGYQHFQYLPYGENWVEQRLGTFGTPYQFSGKEKDEETSYNYFGARFYDSELSIWLSVDPMSVNHSDITPYHYCFNNPLNFIDPIGLDTFPTPSGQTVIAGEGYKSSPDGKYLFGDGLKTKVWNPNFDGGGTVCDATGNPTGGFIDYTGAEIDFSEFEYQGYPESRKLVSDIAFGLGLESTLVTSAAIGNVNPTVMAISKGAGFVGGTVGVVDNTFQAINAFRKGNNFEGALQTTQAAAYLTGTVMLLTPLAPIGAGIIAVNGTIDLVEYFLSD